MKHLFTITRYSLLFMTLTLCTIQIFGMESKEQGLYTHGTQQYSQTMPSATIPLAPEAMQGLNIADDATLKTKTAQTEIQTCEMCDVLGMVYDICEIKAIRKQRLSKLYRTLYNIITTMPPELINLILDYLISFNGKCKRTIQVPDHYLYPLIEAAPGIIAYTCENCVGLWNIETDEHIKSISIVNVRKMLPLTSDTIALGFRDGTIGLLNWKKDTIQEANDKHGLPVIALSKLSDQLFASADPSQIKLWKSETGQHIKTFDLKFGPNLYTLSDYVTALVALTHNVIAYVTELVKLLKPNVITAATREAEIHIYDIETHQFSPNIFHTDSVYPPSGGPDLLVVAPTILAAQHFSQINLWNWKTGQHLKTIQPSPFRQIALSSNKLLAVGLMDGWIELHNLETGRCEKRFKAHECSPNLIAVSGNRLASVVRGEDSNKIKIWE